jgi:UPF0755 protein
MKIGRLIIVAIAIAVAATAITAAGAVYWFTRPLSQSGSNSSFYIYMGESCERVAVRADSCGLFPSPKLLVLMCTRAGVDRTLKVGRYDFTSKQTRWDFFKAVRDGKSAVARVTIPEGLTMRRILSIVADSTGAELSSLLRLAEDREFIRNLGFESRSLEGYLFPETYSIPWGAPPEYSLRVLTNQLKRVIADTVLQRMEQVGYSLHELLTLASLVEAETQVDAERPVIASVYRNRLKIGMPLQCDPTVIFAHGGLGRPLLRSDLEIDSPYNTYKHAGLPPGPICSPGAASIRAVLCPAETAFLYFVADGKGRHVFSSTLEQHNRAVRKAAASRRESISRSG